MTILVFSLVTAVISFLAGFIGWLTGLGGGVVIVPALVLGLGVDIRYAVGAALVSVIATSSGAAAAYVEEGYTNLRLGMFLELATTAGALGGAFLAARVAPSAIAMVFGIVLLGVVLFSPRGERAARSSISTDRLAAWLRLEGALPPSEGTLPYRATRVGLGFALMVLAGALSGLLGIGSGAMKVLAMDWAMRVPFKVSTATSNFMIGVTAAASAGYYLTAGYLDPGLTMPVMLGVLAGALTGARLLGRGTGHPAGEPPARDMVTGRLGPSVLHRSGGAAIVAAGRNFAVPPGFKQIVGSPAAAVLCPAPRLLLISMSP